MENICPVCGIPVPPNEWVSYMRHEDCYVNRCKLPPRVFPHDISKKRAPKVRFYYPKAEDE